MIETAFGYIINEVDEYQHRRACYSVNKEITRMIQLYYDIQRIKPGAEVLFVRFNPDSYSGPNVPMSQRYNYLCQIIRDYSNIDKIGTPVSAVYLFYDGFDGNPKLEPVIYEDASERRKITAALYSLSLAMRRKGTLSQ